MEKYMENLKTALADNLPKTQRKCFLASASFIDEHCRGTKALCVMELNVKFTIIQDSLKEITDKLDKAIGNGKH